MFFFTEVLSELELFLIKTYTLNCGYDTGITVYKFIKNKLIHKMHEFYDI